MARNVYFSQGTANEQYLLEDIIVESMQIYGQDFYYIPRTLVAHDHILGEDRLSKFKEAYGIEMYLETNQGFEGQGAFIEKFGLMMEQSATLTVARRRWDQLVGRHGQTQLPNRPCEGDLLYFPLTRGLFEIKFVQHQDPFYQLGKLYVYRLNVELFQYASEHIETGFRDIDVFESLKSYDTDYTVNATGSITNITITQAGSGYLRAPSITLTGGEGTFGVQHAILQAVVSAGSMSTINIVNVGTGYDSAPILSIGTMWSPGDFVNTNEQISYLGKLYTATVGGNLGTTGPTNVSGTPFSNGTATLVYAGIAATAVASIEPNPDLPQSYGENIDFKAEANNFIINNNNPFGNVTSFNQSAIASFDADTTKINADSTIITSDNQ